MHPIISNSPPSFLHDETIKRSDTKKKLAFDFQPGPFDVICARGSYALRHEGNKRYRSLITEQLDVYSSARTKLDKSIIVSNIVHAVRGASPNGGFVKQKAGVWIEVGDHLAREKIGQSFRDALHFKYKSSTKAKNHRRKRVRQDVAQQVEHFMTENASMASQFEQLTKRTFANISTDDATAESLFDEANQELLRQIKCRTGKGELFIGENHTRVTTHEADDPAILVSDSDDSSIGRNSCTSDSHSDSDGSVIKV